ncbi:MAG: glycosyltransferase [Alphaproteobacteria bacterium]
MSLLSLLATLAATLFFVGAVLLALSAGGTLWTVVKHRSLRPQSLAAERALIARGVADADAPHVVVQIPVFNEGRLVARAVENAIALDWPREKLTIQVLDDSTDDSWMISQNVAKAARDRGFDVVAIHRTSRADFKAGALAAAMANSTHDYFAIFDVDYVIPPRFLRQVMPALLADPKAAFAQARCDHLNTAENRLTRVQAALLDAHYAVEQATRSWCGWPLPFNGTCGIWRKSVIEAAGGWRGDTVAEDLDLSYRARLIGHRGTYLTTVTVPGELPATLDVWRVQQSRWGLGFGQVAKRMIPVVAQSALPMKEKAAALWHLGNWWLPLAAQATYAMGAAALLLDFSAWVGSVGSTMAVLVGLGLGATFAILAQGRQSAERPAGLRAMLSVFSDVVTFGLWVVIKNIGAHLNAIRGRDAAFARTPKQGAD